MARELPVSIKHFHGCRNITHPTTGLAALLNTHEGRIITEHYPVVGAGRADGPPGQLPTLNASGALTYVSFDLAAGTQAIYRTIKIHRAFVGSPVFHLHWTKSDDVDRSGESVRWVVTYKAFNGISEDAAGSPSVIEINDTYDDSGTTARVVYRTPNTSMLGLMALGYLAVKVEKGTPGGSAMASPGLVLLDFTYRGYVNR